MAQFVKIGAHHINLDRVRYSEIVSGNRIMIVFSDNINGAEGVDRLIIDDENAAKLITHLDRMSVIL